MRREHMQKPSDLNGKFEKLKQIKIIKLIKLEKKLLNKKYE